MHGRDTTFRVMFKKGKSQDIHNILKKVYNS